MQTFDLSNRADSSEADFGVDNQGGIDRRLFLKGIGIVSVAVVLAPQTLVAQTDDEAQEWYDLVNETIITVANSCSQARAMESQLDRATMYRVSRPGASFHTRFSAPFIFEGSTIESQPVICGNGFQLVQLPYYDAGCPCGDYSDLNEAEMKAVIHPKEMERFDCVMAAASHRVPFNNDHAEYVKGAAANYPSVNLNDWNVTAERKVRGNGQTRTGFHLSHKFQTRFGKPRKQFIISGDI